jgi:hypothetical protein
LRAKESYKALRDTNTLKASLDKDKRKYITIHTNKKREIEDIGCNKEQNINIMMNGCL